MTELEAATPLFQDKFPMEPREEIHHLLDLVEEHKIFRARAMDFCQQAMQLAEESGSDFEIEKADCLVKRGAQESYIANYDAALRDFSQAYLIYDAHNQQKDIAYLHNLISTIYLALGLYPEAMQGYLLAYNFFIDTDQLLLKIEILNNIGFNYLYMNQVAQSFPYLRECLNLLRANNLTIMVSPVLDSLACAYLKNGNIDEALRCIQEAIEAGYKRGSGLEISQCKNTAAQIYLANGDPAQALALVQEAIALAKEGGFRGVEVECLKTIGEIYIQTDQLDEAIEAFQKSLGIAREIGQQFLIHECFRKLGEVCKRKGDLASSLGFYEQLIDISAEINQFHMRARMQIMETNREIERARQKDLMMQVKNSLLEEEVEKRRQAQQEAEYIANMDALTGMYNRRHFTELASLQIARAARMRHSLAILMIDIDHFKQVNDTYGHITGDEMLAMAARLIRGSMREGDIVGRFGGEEFVILLANTQIEQARQAAERLREAVAAQKLETDKGQVSITISIGIAQINPAADAPMPGVTQVISWADEALYKAKRSGRNCVCIYQADQPQT